MAKLTTIAACLAFVVVILGAYVRLSQAGLSCPDWPGCYGHISVAAAKANAEQVANNFPNNPLEPDKALKEMVHRYAAGTLGLLVLLMAVQLWRKRGTWTLPLLLIGLIMLQVLLGMWTVTLLLKPLVVTAHLAGGMALLALLWWLRLDTEKSPLPHRLRPFARMGLLLLCLQILLGGWTSSHAAGLACSGFPACNGDWWPQIDLAAAFSTGPGADLVAIHWLHRLGALLVLLYLGALALGCRRNLPLPALTLGLLLLAQVAIGIANVLYALPLPLAVAHNAGAALLLLALVSLNHRLASAAISTGDTP